MELNEYQRLAQRTGGQHDRRDWLLNAALGLGEAGEVQNIIKKHLFHGHDLNANKVIDELGDILWYVADMAAALGATLDDVAESNIQKLIERFPDGFSARSSLNRR
jgi:NTP pyrophosphatase (non-canonical NTP hydrolase)